MKHVKVWGLLCIALFMVHTIDAQEEQPELLSCDQKAALILKHKDEFKDYPPQLIDELIAYITPCAEEAYGKTNPSAAYAKGLLHLKKGDYTVLFGRRTELSFLHIFRAAYHKYPPAMFTHGVNLLTSTYKDKRYINYNAISNDFESLIALNYKKDITHYVLGYLNLKNLVTNEDFTNTALVNKAKTHFESSTHPMAKHWLAIMHYFGYGVTVNRAKAIQMLSENNILNSRTLKQQLQGQNNDWIPISAQERLASLEGYSSNNTPMSVIGNGKTTFHGHYIEYDWTAKGVKRYIPVTVSIDVKQDHDRYKDVQFEFTMNGETKIKNSRLYTLTEEYYIGFGQLRPLRTPPLQNLLQDHPAKNTLTYSFERLNFKEAIVDGKKALVVKPSLTTEVAEFNERVHTPIRMVLYPASSTARTATIATISPESENLKPLDKDFATISPNPIGNQFNITYTLDHSAEVHLGVYDLFGQQKISLPNQKYTTGGTQTISVDSTGLPSGTYVIQMTINGQPYSKTVVKL